MIRIDGSEYSEKHSIARLIGAPPGYIGHDSGGQLTEYVRRKPYCIVLIDEIEKASREFVTLFLQVLDDGRLTDGQGRVVDFRNTVIVMTSNLGAAYLNDMGEGPVRSQTRQRVMGAIRAHFPPEFINRIDEIIIFVSNISPGTIKTLILTTPLAYTFSEKHLAYCRPAPERGGGPPLGP
jgi:ATP-dependent Clp protease ATP-binding subunit ClpA